MPGRKCSICGRRISKSAPFLRDEDTGKAMHKTCFQRLYGSLRGHCVTANPKSDTGAAADVASDIVIKLGKFATSPEGMKIISMAADKPLEALMEAAEAKKIIPAGSAKTQAGAVRRIVSSVLREEIAGKRANIAPVVLGALQLVGALYTTPGGRMLIKAWNPMYWAYKAAQVGSGVAGGVLAKKGGKAGKVGGVLQKGSRVLKKGDELEDKGMELVGKAVTLQFNPSKTVVKAGYRKVGKTPQSTTFYLRVVLDDGTNIPSLAAFQHRMVSATEAEIDDGYKAFVGKPLGALVEYMRSHPDKYLVAGEVADQHTNPRERVFSPKLLGPVTRLVAAWDKKHPAAMKEAEEEIYQITGMRKVIPFSLTAEERHDPWLLARRISCIAQLKKRGDDYNPFAVCRSKVQANPTEFGPHLDALEQRGFALDRIDPQQPYIYGVWTDMRFVDDPAYLRFLTDAEATALVDEMKGKIPAWVQPTRQYSREDAAVITVPNVIFGQRGQDQNIDMLEALYNSGYDFTRYFNGTVGNLEITGYWELEGHRGAYRPLTTEDVGPLVTKLNRAGFTTKTEQWVYRDMVFGHSKDGVSIEIENTANIPFRLIENPAQCNPSDEDWKEAIAGEGWAIGDYTAMLEGATPEEAKVLEHIIAEEKEHLDELMQLRGCKTNPEDIHWSQAGPATRSAVAKMCGWETKKGALSSTGKRVVASEWDELTVAARKVLEQHGIRNPAYGGRGHKLLTAELKRDIPPLYSQEYVRDPTVWVKFFSPYSGWEWYITEGSEQDGDYLMFGLVKGFETELGYVSLNELDGSYRGKLPLVERDTSWKPVPMSEVKRSLGKGNPTEIQEERVGTGVTECCGAIVVERGGKKCCYMCGSTDPLLVPESQKNPRGLTSRVFGNLVAVYHTPGFLGPMVGLHMPPMEGFIGGWKKGNADYVLKRGPRGGWRWEHISGDGRYIPLAQDNGVDYSWQTNNHVLEAIHKYRDEWNQRWSARHSIENPEYVDVKGVSLTPQEYEAFTDYLNAFEVEDFTKDDVMNWLESYSLENPTPMCSMPFDALPEWVQKKLRTLEGSMPGALFKTGDMRVTWDGTDAEGRIHFLRTVGLIIGARKRNPENPSFECQECGRKFHRAKVGFEVKCPKCGSYDVDLAVANPQKKSSLGRVKRVGARQKKVPLHPDDTCMCIYEPRGDHGLEGFQLNREYRCQYVIGRGKPYYRVWPEPFMVHEYEVAGPKTFKKYFEPGAAGMSPVWDLATANWEPDTPVDAVVEKKWVPAFFLKWKDETEEVAIVRVGEEKIEVPRSHLRLSTEARFPVVSENITLNKSDLVFQLCAYHGYKREDVEKKTVKELKELLNGLNRARKSNPISNWTPGVALTYQGTKFWEPATFIRWVDSEHAEVVLNEGNRVVHRSLLRSREIKRNPEQSDLIYQKCFEDPETAREWAEQNHVEIIDIYYDQDVAQYALRYQGFPVVQQKYDECVSEEENPRAVLPVTSAIKDAMGY